MAGTLFYASTTQQCWTNWYSDTSAGHWCRKIGFDSSQQRLVLFHDARGYATFTMTLQKSFYTLDDDSFSIRFSNTRYAHMHMNLLTSSRHQSHFRYSSCHFSRLWGFALSNVRGIGSRCAHACHDDVMDVDFGPEAADCFLIARFLDSRGRRWGVKLMQFCFLEVLPLGLYLRMCGIHGDRLDGAITDVNITW